MKVVKNFICKIDSFKAIIQRDIEHDKHISINQLESMNEPVILLFVTEGFQPIKLKILFFIGCVWCNFRQNVC